MRIGTIVGSYQLLAVTGETNWATTYAARRVGHRDLFVANVLHASPENVRRALVETLARDRRSQDDALAPSPTLTTVGGRVVLVSRDTPSESLEELIGADVSWPWMLALALVGRVARILDASLGRPHGDLCPANIHVCHTTRVVEVRNAEIALTIARLRATKERPIGAVEYFAPERLLALDHVSPRTDVYALGLILYELLTRRRALRAASPEALLASVATPRIPRPRAVGLGAELAKVEEIVLRAIQVNPAARYDHPGRLADAIEGYLDSRRPGYDAREELAAFTRVSLADRAASRRLRVNRMLDLRLATPRLATSPPRLVNEVSEARPFVDPALAVEPAESSVSTDDLSLEQEPLNPARPSIAPLLRLLFLASLLVAALLVAFLVVALDGVDPILRAWVALWASF